MKFTILTANYNKRKYLDDWIDSIIKQTYRPIEVVFVDDNSNDNSIKFLNNYKYKFFDNNIELKIIKNLEQLYCGSSYKKALQESTGYYVGVLDSDDALFPNACKEIVNLYKKYPDIFHIYTNFLKCNQKLVKQKKGNSSLPIKNKSLLQSGLKGQHCYSHWRTFAKNINNPEEIFKEDLRASVDKYMGYKLEEKGKGGFYNKPLYLYRYGALPCIVKDKNNNEKKAWNSMKKEFKLNRDKYNIKTYPIVEIK